MITIKKSFPGHKGRPGLHGGSLPRGDTGWVEVNNYTRRILGDQMVQIVKKGERFSVYYYTKAEDGSWEKNPHWSEVASIDKAYKKGDSYIGAVGEVKAASAPVVEPPKPEPVVIAARDIVKLNPGIMDNKLNSSTEYTVRSVEGKKIYLDIGRSQAYGVDADKLQFVRKYEPPKTHQVGSKIQFELNDKVVDATILNITYKTGLPEWYGKEIDNFDVLVNGELLSRNLRPGETRKFKITTDPIPDVDVNAAYVKAKTDYVKDLDEIVKIGEGGITLDSAVRIKQEIEAHANSDFYKEAISKAFQEGIDIKFIEKQLRKDIANSEIVVRLTPTVLKKIFMDGRFKTQFETGRSGGALDTGLRARVEHRLFGLPLTGHSSVTPFRPIYGLLRKLKDTFQNSDSGSQYGSVFVTLKDDVKERTTFTNYDSLDTMTGTWSDLENSNRYVVPSFLNKPSWTSLIDFGQPSRLRNTGDVRYSEVQIFGGVKVTDIAKIRFRAGEFSLKKMREDYPTIEWEQY